MYPRFNLPSMHSQRNYFPYWGHDKLMPLNQYHFVENPLYQETPLSQTQSQNLS